MKLNLPKVCAYCGEKRTKHDLGLQLSDMNVYCLEHEQFDLLPLSDPDKIREEIKGTPVEDIIGKSSSFRLPPHLALHVVKYLQENKEYNTSNLVVELIERHAAENNTNHIELIESPKLSKKAVSLLTENEFIKPKDPSKKVPEYDPEELEPEPEPVQEEEPEPTPEPEPVEEEEKDDGVGDFTL